MPRVAQRRLVEQGEAPHVEVDGPQREGDEGVGEDAQAFTKWMRNSGDHAGRARAPPVANRCRRSAGADHVDGEKVVADAPDRREQREEDHPEPAVERRLARPDRPALASQRAHPLGVEDRRAPRPAAAAPERGPGRDARWPTAPSEGPSAYASRPPRLVSWRSWRSAQSALSAHSAPAKKGAHGRACPSAHRSGGDRRERRRGTRCPLARRGDELTQGPEPAQAGPDRGHEQRGDDRHHGDERDEPGPQRTPRPEAQRGHGAMYAGARAWRPPCRRAPTASAVATTAGRVELRMPADAPGRMPRQSRGLNHAPALHRTFARSPSPCSG